MESFKETFLGILKNLSEKLSFRVPLCELNADGSA